MKKSKKKKQLIYSIFTVLLLTAVLGVITYAWLVNQNAMITMAPVIHPGNIAITGPGGSAIESLDLSYSNDDITVDADGKRRVTIKRDICVKSTEEQYDLEIAHTTNMKGLIFSLYEKNSNTPLSGTFLNLDSYTLGTNGTLQYNIANQNKHSINFEEYSKVQVHAEPLYWKVNEHLSSNKNQTVTENFAGEDVTYYLTDYVLSVTWIEENKETDMFYILAKNVDNTSQNNE